MVNSKLKDISKIIRNLAHNRLLQILFLILGLIILLPGLLLTIYTLSYFGKIYPNIKVADISVGGLTPEQATTLLAEKINKQNEIQLNSEDSSFKINKDQIDLKYDVNESVLGAYELYRTGNTFYDISGRIKLLSQDINLGLRFSYNQDKLDETLSVFAGQVSTDALYPSVKLVNNEVVIENGIPGKDIDKQALQNAIIQNLAFARNQSLTIPLTYKDPSWTDEQIKEVKRRAEKLIGKSLIFTLEGKDNIYTDSILISLLDKENSLNTSMVDEIAAKLGKEINRNPENSVFVFNEGKVQEFKPSKEGFALDSQNFKDVFIDALKKLESAEDKSITSEIPVVKTPPKVTTADVNNLGIKELIGRGTSKFAGSISSRIHNVGLAASRFNGILVEPNKEVSFNEILGDVSAYTGYKQAYVIRDGKTVLGDGGGVCQVSTTLFRALLNAGLPITERRAHSYRVGYYEQGSPPGIDATVFSPTTDLKFKNDTPGHILIQTTFDPKKYELVFEIYGTKDGRVATITKPVVSTVIAPPEDLYIDDPTLPTGTVKQIDFKAWGAKVSFNYRVEKDGVVLIDKIFASNYRPWQAKFLKGTGPAI